MAYLKRTLMDHEEWRVSNYCQLAPRSELHLRWELDLLIQLRFLLCYEIFDFALVSPSWKD